MFSLARPRLNWLTKGRVNTDVELFCRPRIEDAGSGIQRTETPTCEGKNDGTGEYIGDMLNFDYYTGLSPIRVTPNSEIKTSWQSKVASLILNMIGLTGILNSVKFSLWALRNLDGSKVLWYVKFGHQLTRVILHMRYMQLLWTAQDDIADLNRACKMASPPASRRSLCRTDRKKRACRLAYVLRFVSILTCTLCVLLGLTVLNHKDEWSVKEILETHETLLTFGLVPQFSSDNESHLTNKSTKGSWMTDETQTYLLGGSGILLNIVDEVLTTCPSDFLLLAGVSLWDSMQNLMFDKTSLEKLLGDDEMARVFVQKEITRHAHVEGISLKINRLVKFFLPYLAMSNTIIAASFILNCLEGNWFTVIFLSFKISKGLMTYGIADKISQRVDNYYEWFLKRRVHDLLQHDAIDVHLETEKMKTRPIGIGSGVLYINDRFIAGLLGNVSHYFFLLVDGYEN